MVVLRQSPISEMQSKRFCFSMETKQINKFNFKGILYGEKIILQIADEFIIGDIIVVEKNGRFEALIIDETHVNMAFNMIGKILYCETKM